MFGQTHVIYVGLFWAGIVQKDRIIPEFETIHSVVAFRNTEERFSVISFDTGNEVIFSVQFDRACIENRINAETFHKVRICLRV